MNRQPLYLNGRFTNEAREFATVVNPATEEPLAEVPMVDRGVVRQALVDAHAALPAWAALPAKTRGDYLLAVASELQRRSDKIARTMTRENGKPLAQSRTEVAASVDHLRWFAEEARRAYGRVIPNQVAGKRHLVIKSPVGVVGAIAPWNFPLMLAARKVAPALAAGCPVVLKPATQTPLCAIALAECVHAAKLPPGAFQLVVGEPAMVGEEMLNNPVCRKITFTGSTRVGKLLIAGAASQVKRLSLELGGHAPAIVFDDADLNRAVDGVLLAKFRNTGQSCIAANRVLVQAGIYERFVDAFVCRVRAMKVGNGLDDGVEIGAIVSEAGLRTALRHVDDAVARGANVLCGGKRWGTRGYFIEPTVLADVPDDACCMTEETFAPVAPLARFTTESEAIERANRSDYGLAAYVFTQNLDRMFRVAERLEAGTIGVNDGVPSTSNAPFGGMKQSGWGRELGSEGLNAFLETKHVSIGLIENAT
jgi:succinate-semialdehyde dehydrogenase/glutarate-semialdehyde dehydrogenase